MGKRLLLRFLRHFITDAQIFKSVLKKFSALSRWDSALHFQGHSASKMAFAAVKFI